MVKTTWSWMPKPFLNLRPFRQTGVVWTLILTAVLLNVMKLFETMSAAGCSIVAARPCTATL